MYPAKFDYVRAEEWVLTPGHLTNTLACIHGSIDGIVSQVGLGAVRHESVHGHFYRGSTNACYGKLVHTGRLAGDHAIRLAFFQNLA